MFWVSRVLHRFGQNYDLKKERKKIVDEIWSKSDWKNFSSLSGFHAHLLAALLAHYLHVKPDIWTWEGLTGPYAVSPPPLSGQIAHLETESQHGGMRGRSAADYFFLNQHICWVFTQHHRLLHQLCSLSSENINVETFFMNLLLAQTDFL